MRLLSFILKKTKDVFMTKIMKMKAISFGAEHSKNEALEIAIRLYNKQYIEALT